MFLTQKILFNKEECDRIINLVKKNLQNWNLTDRNYKSETLNYHNNTKWIFDKLIDYFISETNIQIISIKKQIHFHKFIKGNWFDKHNDIRDNRVYAIGVLLNDNFEGGDFILYDDNKIILQKEIGNAYIFDVEIEHEISKIISGERYSLLWFLQDEHIKLKTKNLI